MSKNPPKPNTSPDHVKETPEAFTRPSHTEARERLLALAASAVDGIDIVGEIHQVYGHVVDTKTHPQWQRHVVRALAADLRTLLDTPTQEGVGREEIAPVRRIEMVPWDHPFSDEKVEPVWDLEIGGFVAQFPTETSANNFRNAILSLPSPTERANPGAGELRSALEGFDDDYMTSETHHPGYVLIPTEKFERIRAVLSLLPAPKPSVGREEIARIVDSDAWADEDWRTQNSLGERSARLSARLDASFQKANAILSLLPAPKPGEGYVLVPREPTPDMIGAWYRCKNGHHFHDEPPPTDTSDYAAYRAMIAAAPKPQEPAPGAPEGWRVDEDKLYDEVFQALRYEDRGEQYRELKTDDQLRDVTGRIVDLALAALTSSSAKPGGEEQ